jgi:uncharacterized delta-60 repeat protein
MQLLTKLLNCINHHIRNCVLAAVSAVALVSCGGGGGGVSPWIGTKQMGVAEQVTLGKSVTTDANGNVYVAGYTNGGLDGNTLTGTADFFVTKYNSSGVKQYTRQLGVAGQGTYGTSVTTDAYGNVYVTGYTFGGLDGNTLTGNYDFFVTKYNSRGIKQFTRQLGVAGQGTIGNSVATDANGNMYVAGQTTGGLDGNTPTETTDFFVTKYDSSGVKQFTRQLGVAGQYTFGWSVATDANGNFYVAGQTGGGLDGNTLTGNFDFFVTKYDSSGVKQFTQQLGVIGLDTVGYSVATDANGNVYVAGDTTGGLDGNTLTGTTDFFVTKYNSSGVKRYTRQLGVTGKYTFGNSVATDANGNVYVAGDTYGGLDGNTLTGTADFFVTKYNSSGVKQYIRQLGVAEQDTIGNSVTTDANGNVYVAGWTTGSLDGNTLTGTADFFVTKYDSSGVKQYTRQLGVAGQGTFGASVATDANGNVYVAGYTYGGLDGNTLTGTKDFFVTKYNSSGIKQYTRQLGVTGGYASGNSVTTDANGNVYVAGQTTGGLDGNTLTGTYDFFVTKYNSSGVKQYTRQLGVTRIYTLGDSVATDANGNAYVAGSTLGGLDGNTLTGTADLFVTKYNSSGVKQ